MKEFQKVLGYTDLFVCDRRLESALVTAALLKANHLKGGVLVVGDKNPDRDWLRHGKEWTNRHGPRDRTVLVGFQNLAAPEIESFLKVLDQAQHELIGVLSVADPMQWELGFAKAGIHYPDWMIKPVKEVPSLPVLGSNSGTLGGHAWATLRDAKLFDGNGLVESLCLAAAVRDQRVIPQASLLADWDIPLFDHRLGYVIHDIARERWDELKKNTELLWILRVAALVSKAVTWEPGYAFSTLDSEVTRWSNQTVYDESHLHGYVEESGLKALVVTNYPLLEVADIKGPTVQSDDLARYGYKRKTDRPADFSDGLLLLLNLPEERKKDLQAEILSKLLKQGISVVDNQLDRHAQALCLAGTRQTSSEQAVEVLRAVKSVLNA